jgi:hypothetical protein
MKNTEYLLDNTPQAGGAKRQRFTSFKSIFSGFSKNLWNLEPPQLLPVFGSTRAPRVTLINSKFAVLSSREQLLI